MSNLKTITFTDIPDGKRAERPHNISVIVETDDRDGTVDVDTTLFVDGSQQGSLSDSGDAGSEFGFTFRHEFPESGNYDIRVSANVDFSDIGGSSPVEIEQQVFIRDPSRQRQSTIDAGQDEGYATSFDDRASTIITNITTDGDVELGFSEIDFSPYDNPNINVTSGARFAVHEVIGGTTVRQKIGEEPTEITIQGVCTENVSVQIDLLRRALLVTLLSDRTPNGIRAQVASATTEPLEDGGAADMNRGDFLYEFTINLVEISP